MSHDEPEWEPIKGLPALLPEGEHIVWQGEPRSFALMARVFHIRAAAIYFAVLMIWRFVDQMAQGAEPGAAALSASPLAAPALLLCGLLALLGWAVAKTTVYTITNKRVVIRAGVALSKAVNIPFKSIANAGAKIHADGTASIVLDLTGPERPPYLLLWPHMRPFRFKETQPTLRGVPDGRVVAQTLATALAAYHGQAAEKVQQDDQARSGRPGKTEQADAAMAAS